jgi:hypothetical protein
MVLSLEVFDLEEESFLPTQSHEAMSALLISPLLSAVRKSS